MKKILFLSLMFVALATTSCKTILATAEYKDPTTFLRNVTVADLDVADYHKIKDIGKPDKV